MLIRIYTIYKNAVCAQKLRLPPTYMPMWHQIVVFRLSDLENPTLDSIWFHMVPLRSISYYVSVIKLGWIWVYLDHFIPNSVKLGERVQTSLYIVRYNVVLYIPLYNIPCLTVGFYVYPHIHIFLLICLCILYTRPKFFCPTHSSDD